MIVAFAYLKLKGNGQWKFDITRNEVEDFDKERMHLEKNLVLSTKRRQIIGETPKTSQMLI